MRQQDDEDSLEDGLPGPFGDRCRLDCFFDADHGAGNDHCEHQLRCDPLDPGELCLLGELAPGCDEPSCPAGVEPCSDPYACPEGEYCLTGCCRPIFPG